MARIFVAYTGTKKQVTASQIQPLVLYWPIHCVLYLVVKAPVVSTYQSGREYLYGANPSVTAKTPHSKR